MAKHPYMPLWTDAYLGDTTHLTTIEHGAYLLLLMAMWRNGGDLPNDDRLLARFARLTPGQWKRIKPVLWPFFNASSNRITQGRLTDELKAVRQHSKQQSDKARARWLKEKVSADATAMPEPCPHTHTHSSKEEECARASDDDTGRNRKRDDARAEIVHLNAERSDLFARVLRASRVDTLPRLPRYWMPPAAEVHVCRWRDDLGLSEDRIIAAIEAEQHGRDPPLGPKAYDDAMRRLAASLQSPKLEPRHDRPSAAERRAAAADRETDEDIDWFRGHLDRAAGRGGGDAG